MFNIWEMWETVNSCKNHSANTELTAVYTVHFIWIILAYV